MSVVDDFAELFAGRVDAWGTEEGGCVRTPPERQSPDGPAWIYEQHLRGERAIGVYPMVHRCSKFAVHHNCADWCSDWEWIVRWGCADLDIKTETKPSGDYPNENEAHTAAINLQNVLAALGVTAWIERTRSCGRHVWVFATDWTLAAHMRRTLLVACDVAGVSAREVNPKSESLQDGQLGNYLRCVYPGGLIDVPPTRHMLDEYQNPITLDDFVCLAMQSRSAPHKFAEIASLHNPPERRTIERMPSDTVYEGDLVDRMLPYTRDQFEQETPDDRSSALARLCGLLVAQRRNPFEPEEVLELLYAADDRWQKYVGRSDRDRRLAEIVERAYLR